MGGAEAVATAKRQIGKPYVFGAAPYNGGRVPTAFDCSSLVQYAWATQGVNLPRVTHDQVSSSKLSPVDRKDLQPGDLVFFGWSQPNDHVALYAGDNTIIEAANSQDDIKVTKLTDSYWKATTAFRRVKGVGTAPKPSASGPTGVSPSVFGSDSGSDHKWWEIPWSFGKALTPGGNTIGEGIENLGDAAGSAASGLMEAGKLAAKLTQPSTWVRAGAIVIGIAFLFVGLGFMVREVRD